MELKSRIFVTTSPINVLFYLMYVQSKNQAHFDDILIICNSHMSQSSYEKLYLLASQHNWYQIINTNSDFLSKPNHSVSLTKRITRKIRTFKIIQPFYNFSRKIYEQKEKEKQIKWLSETLKIASKTNVELNLLTETTINSALIELYPKASINYFEHGLSDYVMVEKMHRTSNFYCLFHDEFQEYLKQKQSTHAIHPVYQNETFYQIAANYLATYKSEFEKVFPVLENHSNYVLILMQDFENLGVSSKVHVQLFKKIVEYLGEKYTSTVFLVKPHPKQSLEVMNEIEHYLISEKLKFSFLKEPIFQYTSIELFFYLFKDSTSHVFSYYSSGLYYLSKLYPDSRINYMFTFDFIKPEISKMPPEVGAIHNSFINNQLQLFTKNCIEF